MDRAESFKLVVLGLFLLISGVYLTTTEPGTTALRENREQSTQGTDGVTDGNMTLNGTVESNSTDTDTVSNSTDTDTGSSNSTGARQITYRDFPEYDVYKFFDKTYVYFSTWPGIFGNILTIITAARMKPYTPTTICMLVLATADFIACATRIFYFYNGINIASCVGGNFLMAVFYSFSNHTLVIWTVERLIAVAFPMKLQLWCTPRNTKIAIAVDFILCLGLSMIHLFEIGYEVIVVSAEVSFGRCVYSEFMFSYWYYVESVYYMWLPLTTIIFCNITIIYLVSKRKRSHAKMTTNSESQNKRNAEQRRMTYILLSVSSVFLVLHLPYAIKIIIDEQNWANPFKNGQHFYAKYLLTNTVLIVSVQLQNSVNFIIYCLSGPKFRQEFMKVFCFCRKTPSKGRGSSTTGGTAITSVSKTVTSESKTA